MDIIYFCEKILKEYIEKSLNDYSFEILENFDKIISENNEKPDWKETEIINALKHLKEKYTITRDFTPGLLLSICINISKNNNFVFGKEINGIRFLFYKNTKNITISKCKNIEHNFASSMIGGEITIKECGFIHDAFAKDNFGGKITVEKCEDIGQYFASGMKGGEITIKECGNINNNFANNLSGGKITIEKCKNIGSHFDQKDGKITITECQNIGSLFANKLSGGEIIIEKCQNIGIPFATDLNINRFDKGKITITKMVTEIKFNLNNEVNKEVVFNNIVITKDNQEITNYPENISQIYDLLIKDVKKFFSENIHKEFEKVKDFPKLDVVSLLTDYASGKYFPKTKTIKICFNALNVFDNVIIHEYIHHLLYSVFSHSKILKNYGKKELNNLNFSNSEKKVLFLLLEEDNTTNDSKTAFIIEGLTDFLTEFYCTIKKISSIMSYEKEKDFMRNEFDKTLNLKWQGLKLSDNELKSSINDEIFWKGFFQKILGVNIEKNAIQKMMDSVNMLMHKKNN